MEKLKAAVIGLGRMGAEPSTRFEGKIPAGWLPISHAEALMTTEGIELVALCDTDEKKLNHFGALYHVSNLYTDYQKLIAEVKPDIISIATRTDVRCSIIHYALQQGVKGFYAEKPISRNIADCKEVLSSIRESGAHMVYGATRRAMDIYRKAKDLCWSGELGEIQHISIEFGRSAILWTHPHSSDLITFFANTTQLTQVQGLCTFDNETISDNDLVDCDPMLEQAYMTFANGISASIIKTNGLNVRISCSLGNLTIHGDGNSLEINRQGQIPHYFHTIEEQKVDPTASGTQHLFSELRDSIMNNNSIEHVTPEEIICGQQILFGIVQSALQGGSMVQAAELDEQLTVTGRKGNLYA